MRILEAHSGRCSGASTSPLPCCHRLPDRVMVYSTNKEFVDPSYDPASPVSRKIHLPGLNELAVHTSPGWLLCYLQQKERGRSVLVPTALPQRTSSFWHYEDGVCRGCRVAPLLHLVAANGIAGASGLADFAHARTPVRSLNSKTSLSRASCRPEPASRSSS